ncbi:MAG: MerR family transcriptional regulator [Thermoanaerobaculia bacterium]|nr:MerR family transcriptional regulator [Thermoanaerobaculia bacterium]
MAIQNTISRLEVARLLGVQPQTIARWERRGLFPAPVQRLSERVILYDRAEVEDALNARAAKNRATSLPVEVQA